jgi:hypothetical protein
MPIPEDDDEHAPPPICARCGAVITGDITLRTKATAGEVFTQYRCDDCARRAAQSGEPQPQATETKMNDDHNLREKLVATALEWESVFGVAPAITSAVSEYDAARLLGMTDAAYASAMRGATAVRKGLDFRADGVRYQVKGSRPSGRKGSKVTLVKKARNYDWDKLIWIHYNERFEIQEAWLWDVAAYKAAFDTKTRLSPEDYRKGIKLELPAERGAEHGHRRPA